MDNVTFDVFDREEILTTVVALTNTNGGKITFPATIDQEHELKASLALCLPPLVPTVFDRNLQIMSLETYSTDQLYAMPDGRVIGRFQDENRQLDSVQIKKLAALRSVGFFDRELTPAGDVVGELLVQDTNPQRQLRYATVEIWNAPKHTEAMRYVLEGPISQQYDQALEKLFFFRNAFEKLNIISDTILQEIIINALAHRNYRHQLPIVINVNEKELTVSSPGGPPGFATVETLSQQHFHRNPIIVASLQEAGLMQGIGSGLQWLKNMPNIMLDIQHTSDEVLTVGIRAIADEASSLLNLREQRILDHIMMHGSVSESMLLIIFDDIDQSILQQDLLKLIKSGQLIALDSSRGRLYVARNS